MIEGIDVSTYQGFINWQQVRQSGKQFAICKATEGTAYHDGYFQRNWDRSKARGLLRGAYHFFRSNASGEYQAQHFIATVNAFGGFHPGDFAALDLETLDGQAPNVIIGKAEKFVEKVLKLTPAGVFLYTYPDFWLNQLGNPKSAILGKCPLWLADYGPSVPHIPNWKSGLSIWQYSQTGHVPGINGACDLNRFYGDIHAFHTLAANGGR